MADINELSKLIQQSAFYGAGGRPQGQRDIDKIGAIFGTIDKGVNQYNDIVSKVLANKKAELENQKAQEELKTGERETQPIRLLFGSKDSGATAGTQAPSSIAGVEGDTIVTSPQTSLMPKELEPYKNLNSREVGKFTTASYMAQRPEIAMAGLQQKNEMEAARQKRFDENLGMRKREYELNRAMRTDKMNSDVIAKYNSDPDVKKADSMGEAAGTIKELALSDNPIAANSIPTFMARMSGEVGNLSEADKRPFGGSQAIMARLEAAFTQQSQGQLSPENRRYILNLAQLIEKRSNDILDAQAAKYSNQYGQLGSYGNPKTVQNLIRPPAPDDPLGIK